jgi:hypothetical protein
MVEKAKSRMDFLQENTIISYAVFLIQIKKIMLIHR